MTSVKEVQSALLKTLGELALNHGTILKNDSPVRNDPLLRQHQIQESAAKVGVAKLMCAQAGCSQEMIQAVVLSFGTVGENIQ